MDAVNEQFIWKTEAQLLALKNSMADERLNHLKKTRK